MPDRPRALVVEDSPHQRIGYVDILSSPHPDWCRDSPITGFAVEEAGYVERARKLLQEGFKTGKPFEVVLLDLQLPVGEDDPTLEENGRQLLSEIAAQYRVAIVVITAYDSVTNLLHALRRGAFDFVSKPLEDRKDDHELFLRAVRGLGKVREEAHRDLRNERLLTLRDYDLRRQRQEFGTAVNKASREIVDLVHDLQDTLGHRYQLHPEEDAQDPICRNLKTIQETIDALNASLPRHESIGITFPEAETVCITELIRAEIAKVWPSYQFREATITDRLQEHLTTRTLRKDLSLMIAELLFAPLEVVRQGDHVELTCYTNGTPEDIVIEATRSGEPVPDAVKGMWEASNRMSESFDPKWQSLLLLKYLGGNLGVRVDLQSEAEHTTIRMHIPVLE